MTPDDFAHDALPGVAKTLVSMLTDFLEYPELDLNELEPSATVTVRPKDGSRAVAVTLSIALAPRELTTDEDAGGWTHVARVGTPETPRTNPYDRTGGHPHAEGSGAEEFFDPGSPTDKD